MLEGIETLGQSSSSSCSSSPPPREKKKDQKRETKREKKQRYRIFVKARGSHAHDQGVSFVCSLVCPIGFKKPFVIHPERGRKECDVQI